VEVGQGVKDNQMKTNEVERYEAINGLRAFSAIGIVLMHVLANGGYTTSGFIFDKLIPSFTQFVYLFMVISGFSLCCGYYFKITNKQITMEQFYSKRYAKIWPFFALLCLLDIVISPSMNSFYEVFANLTLCFGLLPNSQITVIGVGWFIGVVFVFYLLFPFFCVLLSNKRRAWLSFFVALTLKLLCAVYFFDAEHVPENFIMRHNFIFCAVFFCAGGLIFLYREWLIKLIKRYRSVVLVVCIISSVGVYAFALSGNSNVMVVLFSLFLIYAIGTSGGMLQNSITRFLSGISMEIYLCHMVIFRIIEKLHMTHMFASDELSYAVTSVGTVTGAIIFSVSVKKALFVAQNKLTIIKI
jgi:peptidoglycan/LPS O-acetylase OafA/YrhL